MTPVERIQILSEETSVILETVKDPEINETEKLDLLRRHLKSAYNSDRSTGKLREGKNIMDLSFDSSCEWINTVSPPNLAIVSSQNMIIVEFFTHCCINCIHSIEDLHQAHGKLTARKTQTGLKVISVHSPKFPREKNTDSIRDFVDRMQMTHTDVVNDPNCTLWAEWQIFCWPTILIFGPSRHQTSTNGLNLLFALMGEGHGKTIEYLISNSLNYFDEFMDFSSEPLFSPLDSIVTLSKVLNPGVGGASGPFTFLKYPGKVMVRGNIVAISDSGNNRVIISDADGNVQDVIGGKDRGYKNGDFITARFYNPQGLAFRSNYELFVADTGNHSVRLVNLKTKTVSSLVLPNGTATGENDSAIQLKSPWDLAFYGEEVLLISAAGNHQIFGYFFGDLLLFRVQHFKNSFDLIAGCGKEENRNNNYPLRSAFAQPSGISVSHAINEDDKIIFIADSESSTIRFINSAGKVQPLVGGSRDPSDLFAFGDLDGCFYDVKLQHPMGVCSGLGSTKIFIADTYNHKVKMIDLETKHCTTLIGDGTAGNKTGTFTGSVLPKRRPSQQSSSSSVCKGDSAQLPVALLNEPGGICIDEQQNLLYIADTNNHVIKIADVKTKLVSELELKFDSIDSSHPHQHELKSHKSNVNFDEVFKVEIPSGANKRFAIKLNIHNLPSNLDGGSWKAISKITSKTFKSGSMEKESEDEFGVILLDELTREIVEEIASLNLDIYLCGSITCFRKSFRFHFSITEPSTDALDYSVSKVKEFNFYPSADSLRE